MSQDSVTPDIGHGWTLHERGECMFCDKTREMNPAAVRQWEDFRAKQARNGPSEYDLRRKVEAMPTAAAQWLIEHADDLGLDPEGAAEAADELGRAVANA